MSLLLTGFIFSQESQDDELSDSSEDLAENNTKVEFFYSSFRKRS